MKPESIPEYSSVILINTEGELLLQLRDNNPSIVDPNKISLFAGKLLTGETKEQAASRELFEETTLQGQDLHYLFTYEADANKFGHPAKSHVFLGQGIREADVDVQEGQGFIKIKDVTDLDKHDFALISKEILVEYFATYSK